MVSLGAVPAGHLTRRYSNNGKLPLGYENSSLQKFSRRNRREEQKGAKHLQILMIQTIWKKRHLRREEPESFKKRIERWRQRGENAERPIAATMQVMDLRAVSPMLCGQGLRQLRGILQSGFGAKLPFRRFPRMWRARDATSKKLCDRIEKEQREPVRSNQEGRAT